MQNSITCIKEVKLLQKRHKLLICTKIWQIRIFGVSLSNRHKLAQILIDIEIINYLIDFVSEMNYYVSGGTLNLTHFISNNDFDLSFSVTTIHCICLH